jgi:predicted permease
MDSILQDLRYALRSLRRSPIFTVVAAITIGIGIGATTTIFSVANSILLRDPTGVRQTDQLVTVHALSPDGSSFHSFSYPTYAALRDAGGGLSSLSAYGIFSASLQTEGEPQIMLASVVTGEYFQTLGTQPAIGRLLLPSDDRGAGGADAVVVLSHGAWIRRFAGDSAILGRTVVLNRLPFTVIGVAEQGFQGHTAAMDIAAWVPMGIIPVLRNEAPLDSPNASWLELIGRRSSENVSPEAIAQQLSAASAAASERLGRDPKGVDVKTYQPIPAQAALPVAGFFGLLLLISGVILFIGSVNVGGLLLSRATARSREIAIRLAIGARRGQLVRQLLTESLVLFMIGGSAGLGLAVVATGALAGVAPPVGIPLSFDFSPDVGVMAAALAMALVTGIVFGLVPALQSTRLDLAHAVRDEELGGRLRKSRLRNIFVTAQVAGSALLLVVGGLFVRALGQAGSIDLGFAPEGLYAVQADLRIHHYTAEQQIEFAAGVRSALLARREISAVAGIDMLPLSMSNQSTMFQLPGRDGGPEGGMVQTDFANVTPGYFQTMGIPLLKGRDFSDADRAGTPLVGIMNETLAQQVWPNEEVLGKIILFGGAQGETQVEIVGVVRNSKVRSLGEEPVPMMYMAYAQNPSDKLALVARARSEATPIGGLLRQAVRDADPALPLLGDAPLSTTIGVSLLPNWIAALLASLFGAVGLVLATVGLYGLLAFTVTRRRREIGIRMALGAQAGDVRRLVLGQGLRLTLIGLAIGFALAFAATRLLGSFLFGVSPLDPLTFGAITFLLGSTAAIACIVPAARATRTDPMVAIRHD